MAKFFQRRMPAYLGGLLLSLAAMVVIFQAKRAFAPIFHDIPVVEELAGLAPGGTFRISYTAEPGLFLPPGFPTKLLLLKQEGEIFVMLRRFGYSELTEREGVKIELREPGRYRVEGELYICSGPGESQCALLKEKAEFWLGADQKTKETVLKIDLPALAAKGMEIGAKSGLSRSK